MTIPNKLKVEIQHMLYPQKYYDRLIESVQRYMEFLTSEDYHEDSLDGYKNEIYEYAVEMVYGPDVWKEGRRIKYEHDVLSLKQRHATEVVTRMTSVYNYTSSHQIIGVSTLLYPRNMSMKV